MDKLNNSERRDFLKKLATISTVNFVPSNLLFGNTTPSEQFRFAQIGCGGKGGRDLENTLKAGGKLVAMCDVDERRAHTQFKLHPDIQRYEDYRVLLDKHENEIDGVVISTPDHTHGCIALEAIRRGKHVYVQKPLARTYEECQSLLSAAEEYKVVTQMGNQHHSASGIKIWEHMYKTGALGEVKEVHTWTHKPSWPQGMSSFSQPKSIPAGLNWNLWQGPLAHKPFNNDYLPFNWRGWWDYGCGAMGDMACHIMDAAFWIFKLGMPTKVKATASAPATISYPEWSTVEYYFDKTGVSGKPLTLTWYDGIKKPDLPKGCHPNLPLPNQGCIMQGSNISAMAPHPGQPIPISTGLEYKSSEVKEVQKYWKAEKSKFADSDHYKQWINAAKAGTPEAASSNFDYSTPFTQSILLGCIALRYPGQELIWDSNKNQFSNFQEANQWLSFNPENGFRIK